MPVLISLTCDLSQEILATAIQLPLKQGHGVLKLIFAIKVDVEFGSHHHAEPAIRLVAPLHHKRHNGLLQLEGVLGLCAEHIDIVQLHGVLFWPRI